MKQLVRWLSLVFLLIFISYNSFGYYPFVFKDGFLAGATALFVFVPIVFLLFGLTKLFDVM